MSVLIACIIGYLLGSIPNGYIVGRLMAGVDVRTVGSGKTGATNVRRLVGWKGFFLVLLMDVAKGALAVLLARWLLPEPNYWAQAAAGIFAVVGHTWPVFLGFKGGRGLATGMGALLMMVPLAVLLLAVLGVPLVIISRYISLGSVTGSALAPIVVLLLVLFFHQPWAYFVYTLVAALLVIAMHRDNIQRLLQGTERRI